MKSLLARDVGPRPLWAGLVVLAIVIGIMYCWTWGTWPDVLVDFGRELYIPWQLTEGKVLYTDIAYNFGPFSPYLNALWFVLFGVSLQTLVFCNLAIFIGLCWILYELLSTISGRFSATVAGLTLVTLFGFGQLSGIGNYNFICPYRHEMTHGIALSAIAIACLSVYQRCRQLRWLGGAGIALGLVFLTKAELFIAVALALVAGLGLTVWTERPGVRRALAMFGTVLAAVTAGPILAFVLLSRAMDASDAWRGTLGVWALLDHRDVLTQPFFQWAMGTLDPAASLRTILKWCVAYAVLALPVAWVSLRLRRAGWYRVAIATVLVAVLVSIGVLARHLIEWSDLFRPLPLVMLLIGIISCVQLARSRRDSQMRRHLIMRVTMVVWALALLARIILYARVYHYGFALAMPATLLLVVALVEWVPGKITRLGGAGGVFRLASLAVVVVMLLIHVEVMQGRFARKVFRMGHGRDAFWADARGVMADRMLEEIDKRVSPDETLAVFPAGEMLNYLARRANPTPYINRVIPSEMLLFGEARILASYQAHPPDYIVLVHRDTTEYGVPFFGQDYGQKLYAWVQDEYHEVVQIGARPLQDWRFGILLLEHVGPDLSDDLTN